jgi:diacylglycerol O-acyltransferase
MTTIIGADGRWLREERATHPMHTSKVLVLASARGQSDRIFSALEARLSEQSQQDPLLRLRPTPPNLGPFGGEWFDVGHLELHRHLFTVGIGSGERDASLDDLVSRLATAPLARDRPLWDATVVTEAGSARAIVLRLHHAIADASVASRLLSDLFGPGEQPDPADHQSPTPATGLGLVGAAALVADTARGAWRARATRRKSQGVQPRAVYAGPHTSWSSPPSSRRVVASAALLLSTVREVASLTDTRVGEVTLAVVAGGLRRHLAEVGELPGRAITAAISTSRWPVGVAPTVGNRLGALIIGLATDCEDPLARLTGISQGVRAARQIDEARGPDLLDRWWDLYPAVHLGRRIATAVSPLIRSGPSANLSVSVVKGPSDSLSCGGVPIEEIRSVGVLSEDIGLTILGWSYRENLSLSLVACPDTFDHLDRLAAQMVPALQELRAALSSPVVPSS